MLLARILSQFHTRGEDTGYSVTTEHLTIIIATLNHVDEHHFGPLNNLATENVSVEQLFGRILRSIEEYLLERQLQKLERQYKRELLARRDVEQLMELVLLVAIKSTLKNKVVQVVMQCDEQEQQYLMNTIKKVEGKCYNLVGLKQVISRIESLEQESQQLKEQCERQEKITNKNIEEVQDIQLENESLENGISKQKIDQQDMKSQLGFFEIKQFVESSLQLKKENNNLVSSIAYSCKEQAGLIEKNNHLKKELNEYANIIKSHIEEAERLKNWYHLIQQENAPDTMIHQSEKKSTLRLPLAENPYILNIPTASSRKAGAHTDRTHYTEVHNLEESFELAKPLNVQLQVARLQEEEELKQQQLTDLRSSLRQEVVKRRTLDKKVNLLRQTHQNYMRMYAAI